MKQIIFIVSVVFFFSCSKEIQDGPYVYFANDTMSQQKSLTFTITAIGNSYKVKHAQLFINQTSFRDSIFTPTDSISITWEIDFTGRINTQNILIQATDEHEMVATQTKKIYIK